MPKIRARAQSFKSLNSDLVEDFFDYLFLRNTIFKRRFIHKLPPPWSINKKLSTYNYPNIYIDQSPRYIKYKRNIKRYAEEDAVFIAIITSHWCSIEVIDLIFSFDSLLGNPEFNKALYNLFEYAPCFSPPIDFNNKIRQVKDNIFIFISHIKKIITTYEVDPTDFVCILVKEIKQSKVIQLRYLQHLLNFYYDKDTEIGYKFRYDEGSAYRVYNSFVGFDACNTNEYVRDYIKRTFKKAMKQRSDMYGEKFLYLDGPLNSIDLDIMGAGYSHYRSLKSYLSKGFGKTINSFYDQEEYKI